MYVVALHPSMPILYSLSGSCLSGQMEVALIPMILQLMATGTKLKRFCMQMQCSDAELWDIPLLSDSYLQPTVYPILGKTRLLFNLI